MSLLRFVLIVRNGCHKETRNASFEVSLAGFGHLACRRLQTARRRRKIVSAWFRLSQCAISHSRSDHRDPCRSGLSR
jgi:hypothetical protein